MTAFPWEVVSPSAWPNAPTEMSYSVLTQIETCPRRYGLERGTYKECGRGYPRPVPRGALKGTVVHGALERFSKTFRNMPGNQPVEERVHAALRELGGISQMLRVVIEEAIAGLEKNPRCAAQVPTVRSWLFREVPGLRGEVQRRLQALNLRASPVQSRSEGSPSSTNKLPLGVYPELTVHHGQLGWKGTFDLLILGSDGTTLYEFKTGARKPEHEEQLRIYALLWRGDERNAKQEAPDRLQLVYPDGTVVLQTPTALDLKQMEASIAERTERARQAMARGLPVARVASESCRWCGVRHLCAEYWTAVPLSDTSGGQFIDLEVDVVDGLGPGVFSGIVLRATAPLVGKSVTLIATAGAATLEPACRFRVLGARWSPPEDPDEVTRVTLGDGTEGFRVKA